MKIKLIITVSLHYIKTVETFSSNVNVLINLTIKRWCLTKNLIRGNFTHSENAKVKLTVKEDDAIWASTLVFIHFQGCQTSFFSFASHLFQRFHSSVIIIKKIFLSLFVWEKSCDLIDLKISYNLFCNIVMISE